MIILEASQTILRLFPRRILEREIPLTPPEQWVCGLRRKATEESLLFRAWSF